MLLVYSGELDPTSIPDPADFSVSLDGVARSLTSVTIPYVMYGGLLSVVRLQLDAPYSFDPSFTGGDIGTVTYGPGAHPLRTAGAAVDGFVGEPVGIAVPDFELLAGLTDEGQGPDHVIAMFSQPLTAGPLPDPGDFSVTVTPAGGSPTTVSPVGVSVAAAMRGYGVGFLDLQLGAPLSANDVVSLTYTPGVVPLLDLAGTALGSGFADHPVTMGLAPTSTRTTAPGSNVIVAPADAVTGSQPVTLTFQAVSAGGTTNVASSTTAPALPSGFAVLGTYYDVQTTAAYGGSVTLCFSYADLAPTDLLHYESGAWVTVPSVLDTANHQICGTTTSLSPFALVTRMPSAPVLTVPGSIIRTAAGPAGAVVRYSVVATDYLGSSLTTSCSRGSGSTFPVGRTIVSCTATDSGGRNSVASFAVTVGYRFVGFGHPLVDAVARRQAPRLFMGGSTIPVDFSLTYGDGVPIRDSVAERLAAACAATISVVRTRAPGSPASDSPPGASRDAADCFRYDTGANKFVFGLRTGGLPHPAVYVLSAVIADAGGAVLASHSVVISLR